MGEMSVIELPEYETIEYNKDEIPEPIGKHIFDKYSNQVDIEFPTYKSGNKWRLTNKGWAGYIPLSESQGVYLKPKVNIKDIFRMWEYAYNLRSFKFLDGQMECDTLEGFYERLASLLADLVIERGRKGYYKAYKDENSELSYVRGRIDISNMVRKSWQPKIPCNYQELSLDIFENQLITWTLYNILRMGVCGEKVLLKIRTAYRNIQSVTSLKPFYPKDCNNNIYNRLNEDYRMIHMLCKFFLEHSGPSINAGQTVMLPFIVNMPKLYEMFVAEWLKENLPTSIKMKTQESIRIGKYEELSFKIDIVLYDANTMNPIAVLDTKYKNPDIPSQTDINQIATYALSINVKKAILVYPAHLNRQFTWNTQGITVQSQIFDISKDVNTSGQTFINLLLN